MSKSPNQRSNDAALARAFAGAAAAAKEFGRVAHKIIEQEEDYKRRERFTLARMIRAGLPPSSKD